MEITIVIACVVIGFLIGAICFSESSSGFEWEMYELENRRRQEAEMKLFEQERQMQRCGQGYPCSNTTATHFIQMDSCYRKGFYDGHWSAIEDKMRFKSVDETREMFERLTGAMKPLENLRDELDTSGAKRR